MASIFDIYKVFRPRKTILSDDFNSLQTSLKASFDGIGTEAPSGKLGVSSPFYCGSPTEGGHAVTLTYHVDTIDVLVEGALVDEQAQAQASADAAAASAAAAEASSQAAETIRFEDAIYLTFFFGQS